MADKINLGKTFGDNISSSKGSLFNRFGKKGVEFNFQDILIGVSTDFRDLIQLSALRYFLVKAVLIGLFIVLVSRLIYVQVVSGSGFLAKSFYNSIRLEVIHPQRGVIYDRHGVVLARSQPSFRVAVDPQKLSGDDRQIGLLSDIAKIDKNQIYSKLDISKTSITLGNADNDIALQLRLNESKLPAVSVEISPIRDYPFGEAFAPLLGYAGEVSEDEIKNSNNQFSLGDAIGKVGVELSLDDQLRGQSGRELVRVDSKGEKSDFTNRLEPIHGKDVILSFDSLLQRKLYEALKGQAEKYKAKGAAAVAVNPKNGEVLALVSYPAYDNNLFAKGLTTKDYERLTKDPRLPMTNRAISGQYPPASTFKIITAAAALGEKVIDTDKKLTAPDSIELGGTTFRDWKFHGEVNLIRALAQSSDTYFYQIGGGYGSQAGVGPHKLADWSKKFGLGQKTGIDLVGEEAGFVPTPEWKKGQYGEDWYTGNTFNMAIGQGDVLATPLQIAQFTTAIANGGYLYEPQLLKDAKPKLIRSNFVSPEIVGPIKQGMKEAVEPGGTAWPLRDFRIKSAAKTGTAEAQGDPHAIMTAFAPLDSPEIVLTVFVENGGQGSDVAGPVVRAGLEEWFKGR